jgi:RimJ/RimL family protein N-acetyltransferase
MIIRELQIEDAEKFLNLINKADSETSFLSREKGERKLTVEQEKMTIKDGIDKGALTYVIEDNERLVGYVWGNTFPMRRRKHCMYVAIAILQEYTGKGYGKKLMQTLEKQALQNGISRFELTVMTHNKIAVNLYKNMGYVIEGNIKNSMFINEEFVDEYSMAKVV